MDAVFGPENFKNEIVWKRSTPHGNTSQTYGAIHDVVLFFSKSCEHTWTRPHKPYLLAAGVLDPEMSATVLKQYGMVDEATGRRFQPTSLLNPNPDRPNLTYEFHGHTKVWRWTRDRMELAEREGRLYFPRDGDGVPREKRYLDEQEGIPLQDVWNDIGPLSGKAAERLGYPTQKPLALLERIVSASSNPGDVVLDPFAGCGTAVVAAQKLGRDWIGIDITHLAITLVRHRLFDTFGTEVAYKVIGEPVSLPDAEALAEQDAFQFQLWALGLVGARPAEQKKGADRGVDGRIYFHDEPGKTKQIVISVKSGHVTVSQVRDLRGVLEREKAQIALFITLHEPTQPMRSEAAGAGFYDSPGWQRSYPRLQILTIEGLLRGQLPEYPLASMTFRRAERAQQGGGQQQALPL